MKQIHEMIWTIEVDTTDMEQDDIDMLEADLANHIASKLGKDKVNILDYNPMLVKDLQEYYNKNFMSVTLFEE